MEDQKRKEEMMDSIASHLIVVWQLWILEVKPETWLRQTP